jgi:VanZ like family/Concanavalin A-like lectin/glucanases superfamily
MARPSSSTTAVPAPTRVALLPLSIGLILSATVLPVELRAPAGWSGALRGDDFLANVLLFVPLGICLSRGRLLTAALTTLALSGAVETLQLWEVERFVSLWDLLANVLGSILGAGAWRMIPGVRSIDLDRVVLRRPGLAVLLIFIALVMALWGRPPRSASLAFWHSTFPLQLGNEYGGGRSWRGAITSLSLLASLPPEGAFGPLGQVRTRSAESIGDMVYSSDTLLRLDGPAVPLPQPVAATLAHRAAASDAFAVIVRMTPADTIQRGPARIISFSADTLHRNFDLGQEGPRLVLRVATAVSGENGNDYRVESFPSLAGGQAVTVTATYDGEVGRIFVDGRLTGRSNLAAAGCAVRAMCDTSAPFVWFLVGASISLSALYFSRAGSALRVVPTGLLALPLPWLPPVSAGYMASHQYLALWAILGVGMVGWSAHRALRAPDGTSRPA